MIIGNVQRQKNSPEMNGNVVERNRNRSDIKGSFFCRRSYTVMGTRGFFYRASVYKNNESNDTHSLSASATVHLYCAVEKRQMSANCLTVTLIFLTVRLLLFAMCTLTAMFSPWW